MPGDHTGTDLVEDRQRITVRVDLVAGPFSEAVAGRLLQMVVDELGRVGCEITGVRVEIRVSMASW
ncbi:MAG: hypothetical protein ACLQUT_06245 [Thermoleophilia bacterium]